MIAYLIVFLGAGLGGVLRYGISLASVRLFGLAFPYGTLAINVVGSLAMGLVAGYFMTKGEASPLWRLLLATGVLGGFTTFSTFSLETVLLWERGELLLSIVYVVASVGAGVLGLVLGLMVMRQSFA